MKQHLNRPEEKGTSLLVQLGSADEEEAVLTSVWIWRAVGHEWPAHTAIELEVLSSVQTTHDSLGSLLNH